MGTSVIYSSIPFPPSLWELKHLKLLNENTSYLFATKLYKYNHPWNFWRIFIFLLRRFFLLLLFRLKMSRTTMFGLIFSWTIPPKSWNRFSRDSQLWLKLSKHCIIKWTKFLVRKSYGIMEKTKNYITYQKLLWNENTTKPATLFSFHVLNYGIDILVFS